MKNLLRNIAAIKLAKSSDSDNLIGTIAKLGFAERLRTSAGTSGTLANLSITARQAKIGAGVLAGAAIATGAVVGAQWLLQSALDSQDA